MKKIFKVKKLNEAEAFGKQELEFMTKSEAAARRLLLAFLRDDGRGHHHAKFAKRFESFAFKFVSAEYANSVTGGAPAWIQFEDRLICIQKDFLKPFPEELGGIARTYAQLSVLLRHELIHALLRHEIRMLAKFKKDHNNDEELAKTLNGSASLGHLTNIIMDFEISDQGYDAEDVKTVRMMTLNGKEIGGLVVAIDEPEWIKMPLEQMYDALEARIASLNDTLNTTLAKLVNTNVSPTDMLANLKLQLELAGDLEQATGAQITNRGIADAKRMYALPIKTPSSLNMPVFEFINTKFFKQFKEHYKACSDIISKINDNYLAAIEEANGDKKAVDDSYRNGPYRNQVSTIIRSAVTEPVVIDDPFTGEVLGTIYTPEEKKVIINVLKECAGLTNWAPPYEKWFNKMDEFKDDKYSAADIQAVIDALEAQK